MSYIGNKPANKAVVASDLDPAVITGQTALAVAPADTDEFLISDAGTLKRLDASLIGGGGILQVKTINKLDTQTISSSSFTAISSFTVSLTPSSSSSKILIFGTVCFGTGGNLYGQGSIYRQINSGGYSQLTTAIGNADGSATRCTFPIQTVSTGDQTWKVFSNSFNFLDAPSTTNQVDYQIYCRSNGSTNIRINEEDNATDGDYDARPISTLTIMEIDSGVL